jgi:two-component system, OmpR family, sensor kinase ParS
MAGKLTTMLVKRLIIKFYLLLVFSVAALGLAIDHFMQRESTYEIQQANSRQHFSTALYIESLLTTSDKTLWPEKAKLASEKLSVNIKLLEWEDIDVAPDTMQKLKQGELVTLALEKKDILLKKIEATNYLLQIEVPYIENKNTGWMIMFYLLLVFPVLFWFWPLAQDLNQLERATKEFGKNNLSYRIATKSSSAISTITQTFNQMAKRIQYLIEEQKSLTNAVSHEIRTPLARLKFALELEKKSYQNEAEQQPIIAMQKDVEELSHLVDEMLSYAKLDNVDIAIELQKVAAKPWLTTVVDECRKSNQKIDIQIDSSDCNITIDPHLMARAISNLVHNAFRFASSTILVQLTSTKQGLEILVSDDGPGIPKAQRKRLFEPFAKIDQSRNKQALGFGLGLAIVKRIVDKHKGQITITDSVLGGAQFKLRFEPSRT